MNRAFVELHCTIGLGGRQGVPAAVTLGGITRPSSELSCWKSLLFVLLGPPSQEAFTESPSCSRSISYRLAAKLFRRRAIDVAHEGHELDWTERSWRADPEVSDGEESHKIIVRDLQAFGQIFTRLKAERGWE